MAVRGMTRVPARDKDVYEALAQSWREAYVYRRGDRATAVANFSYVSKKGTWLVRFGAENDCYVFPEDEPELTSDELRDRLGLGSERPKRKTTKPSKAAVVEAARKLAAMLPEVPEEIAAILAAA